MVDAALTADRTYYWRAKADDGANESDYSSVAKFDFVVPIVIEAPVPISPVSGLVASSTRPALVVNNAGVQGRAGRVEYWFEVSLDQAFSKIIVQQGVERSSGAQTSLQMPDLPSSTLLFWRVAGFNGTIAGPWSLTQSFRTPAATAPAPGPSPSPSPVPPPPAAGCSASGSPANWSTDQWRECFFALVAARGVGPTVTSLSYGHSAARPRRARRGLAERMARRLSSSDLPAGAELPCADESDMCSGLPSAARWTWAMWAVRGSGFRVDVDSNGP